MSFIGNAVGKIVGGITGASQQAKAAEAAAGTQAAASEAAIAEQRRQFDALTELLRPYVETGYGAIGRYEPYQQAGQAALFGQQALIGLQGSEKQKQAINAIAQSPELRALAQQGESAILQSASATGGLRGGNVQAALAQFRPALLRNLLEQQYSRLGGLAGTGLQATSELARLGQASAAGTGAAGLQSAGAIGELLAQRGAALAGGQIAAGSVPRQAFGDILRIGGAIAGGMKGF